MKALIVEPLRYPKLIDIKDTDDLYKLIDCELIECVYPFKENIVLICDESGAINGRQFPNRLVNKTVIFGTFVILGLTKNDEFTDLDNDLLEKYLKHFYYPEVFYYDDDGTIQAVKWISG